MAKVLRLGIAVVCTAILANGCGFMAGSPKKGDTGSSDPAAESPPASTDPLGQQKLALIDRIAGELRAGGMGEDDISLVTADMKAAAGGLALNGETIEAVIARMTKAAVKALVKLASVLGSSEGKRKFSGLIAKGAAHYYSSTTDSTAALAAGTEVLAQALASGVAEIATGSELADMLLETAKASTTALITGAAEKGVAVDESVLKANAAGMTGGIIDAGIPVAEVTDYTGKIAQGTISAAVATGNVSGASAEALSKVTESIVVGVLAKVQTKAQEQGQSAAAAAAAEKIKDAVVVAMTTAATENGVSTAVIKAASTTVESSAAVQSAVTAVQEQVSGETQKETDTQQKDEDEVVKLQLDLFAGLVVTNQTSVNVRIFTGNYKEEETEQGVDEGPSAPSGASGRPSVARAEEAGDPDKDPVTEESPKDGYFEWATGVQTVQGWATEGVNALAVWKASGSTCGTAPSFKASTTVPLSAAFSLGTAVDGSYWVCVQGRTAAGGLTNVASFNVVLDRTGPAAATLSGAPTAIVYGNDLNMSIQGTDVHGYKLFKFVNPTADQTCATANWPDYALGKTTAINGELVYFWNKEEAYLDDQSLPVNTRYRLCIQPVDQAGNPGPVLSANWERRFKAEYTPVTQVTQRQVREASVMTDFSGANELVMHETTGKIHAAYRIENDVKYRSSTDNGGTWSAAVDVVSMGGSLAVSSDADEIVIAIVGFQGVVIYRSVDGGSGWAESKVIDPTHNANEKERLEPAVALLNNVVLLTWMEEQYIDDSWAAVYRTARSGDFSSWGFDAITWWGGRPHSAPLFRVNGDKAWLIAQDWDADQGDWTRTRIRSRQSGDSSWSAPVAIGDAMAVAEQSWWQEYYDSLNHDQECEEDKPCASTAISIGESSFGGVDVVRFSGGRIYVLGGGNAYFHASLSADLAQGNAWTYVPVKLHDDSDTDGKYYREERITDLIVSGSAVSLLVRERESSIEPMATFLYSTADGTTWTPTLIGHDVYEQARLAVNESQFGLLYPDAGSGRKWRRFVSQDSGSTWSGSVSTHTIIGKQIARSENVTQMASLGTVRLAAGNGRLARSADGGASWSEADLGDNVQVGVQGSNFVLTSSSGWFATSADGVYWSSRFVTGDPTSADDKCWSQNSDEIGLAIAGSVIMFGYRPCGEEETNPRPVQVLRSSDGGATFAQASLGDVQNDWNAVGIHKMRVKAAGAEFYRVERRVTGLDGSDNPIYELAVRTSSNGSTWGDIVTLADGDFDNFFVDGSTVYLTQGRNITRYDGTFHDAVDINPSANPTELQIHASGNSVTAYYLDSDARNLVKVASSDSGDSFGSPTVIDGYDAGVWGLGLSATGGSVHLIWSSSYGLGSKILTNP